MNLQFYGGNCFKIQSKNATIIIDDFINEPYGKSIVKKDHIALFTKRVADKPEAGFLADVPGEYEIKDVSIRGVAARAHIDEAGSFNSTIYRVVINNFKIASLGHIHPELSEDQLEEIGMVDILTVPVGGNGYTLDALGALKVIKKISPKIVIPSHYAIESIGYEVPQASLEDVLKNISMDPAETLDELKLKTAEFSESTKLIILTRQ